MLQESIIASVFPVGVALLARAMAMEGEHALGWTRLHRAGAVLETGIWQ